MRGLGEGAGKMEVVGSSAALVRAGTPAELFTSLEGALSSEPL